MNSLPPASQPSAPVDALDNLAALQRRFARFGSDLAGLALLTLALLTLLGLLNWSSGAALDPWVNTLKRGLGWGAFALPVILAAAGRYFFLRPRPGIAWGRALWLEAAFFFALCLLALAGGFSIENAEQGRDGGYVGWSLVYLLEVLAGDIGAWFISLSGFLLAALAGFHWLPGLEAWLWAFSGRTPPGQMESLSAQPPAAEEQKPAPAASAPRKPAISLPEQFRKNFKLPEKPAEKPAEPKPRAERLPPLSLLSGEQNSRPDERHINQTAGLIEKTLDEFGIPVKVIGFRVGPTVTQFAVQPGFISKPGLTVEDEKQLFKVRVAQIASLQKDLALALSAERLRIEAPVPGKPYLGIEVPNQRSSMVRLRPLLESESFQKMSAPLTVALGRDVSGAPLLADLSRMPHLLIAGATGSGKSVFVTALAACLAMNNAPEDLRIVMIDAKMVELIRFNGLPHLLGKVETDVNRITGVLRWVVAEMEHRYRLLEGAHARDLEAYNRKAAARKDGSLPLPRMVVIIDELADLMMSAPEQTEHTLVRLAQMARATGIHLVVATQRPSTDVVTGLIKANFPARLAFSVASGIDSRVILDTPGAETLLGRGDMLFLNPEAGAPMRAQGVYVTDQEVERLVAFWQKMSPAAAAAPPWESLLQEPEEGGDDALLEQAESIVRQSQRANVSLLQRKLRIGYPRAARLLDQLEEMGIVGPSQGGSKDREVLVEPSDENNDISE